MQKLSRPSERQKSNRCPCCGFKALYGRGQDEICPVCFWEDDGQDDHDADDVRGGPNGSLSLTDARANFGRHGVSDLKHVAHVRPPTPLEIATRRTTLEGGVTLA